MTAPADEALRCEHCWHDTGRMLTSDPPWMVEVCCKCGKQRSLQLKRYIPEGEHGPYAPR